MKVLFVTLLFCIASTLAELTEEQKEMIKPYKDACMAEMKIDQAAIDMARKTFKEEGKFEIGQMGCFSACMFKKIGFMNEEGKFDEEMVRALTDGQFPEAQMDVAIGACKDEAGKDDCETAGKLVLCFLKQGISVSP